jgi:minor extracellular serine protease Vpr
MRGTRKLGPAILAFLMALALAGPASAGPGPDRLTPDGPTPDIGDRPDSPEFSSELWFVEFASEPQARGGSNAAMARERNALRRDARANDIDYEERYDFRGLWNGLSVKTTAAEAHALAELSSAVAVYPVELIDAPEPEHSDPQLNTALGMTGADNAQDLGFDGSGLSVAIVDTGIDYGHPDLGGDGEGTSFPTQRVTHGYDFAGDDYNAADPDNDVPTPNPDPMDINGHGTHVAGIVGANAADDDGVTGVAPGVTFGAYKVFGTSGSSSADVIIAALEMAAADGMDVINMSLGAGYAWGDYPTSKVSDQLVEDGVVVVASAGNAGASGVFSLGAPGNAEKVIGVASADNLFMNAHVMEIVESRRRWQRPGALQRHRRRGDARSGRHLRSDRVDRSRVPVRRATRCSTTRMARRR